MSIAFSIPNIFEPNTTASPNNEDTSYLHILNNNLTPTARPDGIGDDVVLGWLIRPTQDSESLNSARIEALPLANLWMRQVIMTVENNTAKSIRMESMLYGVGTVDGTNFAHNISNPTVFELTSIEAEPYKNQLGPYSGTDAATFSLLENFLGDTKSYFFSASDLKILFEHLKKAREYFIASGHTEDEFTLDLVFSGSHADIGMVTSQMNMEELNTIAGKHEDAKAALVTAYNAVRLAKDSNHVSVSSISIDEITAEDMEESTIKGVLDDNPDFSTNTDLSKWFTLKTEVRATINGVEVTETEPVISPIDPLQIELAQIFQTDMKLPTMAKASPCPPGYGAVGVIHESISRYVELKTLHDQITVLEQRLEDSEEDKINLEQLIEELRQRIIELLQKIFNLENESFFKRLFKRRSRS